LARLERALAIVSYAIVLDGPAYGPFLQRLEGEIAAHRAQEDVVARAQRNVQDLYDLARSVTEVGANAIAERYLNFNSRP
jgi:hypothetical protein